MKFHSVSKYKFSRNAIKGQSVDIKVKLDEEYVAVSTCSEFDFVCLTKSRQETLYSEEGLYKDLALLS